MKIISSIKWIPEFKLSLEAKKVDGFTSMRPSTMQLYCVLQWLWPYYNMTTITLGIIIMIS